MADDLTKAQIRHYVNEHIARDLARSDPEFVGVARSARYAEAQGGLLAACIGAVLADAEDIPETTKLVISANRRQGVVERIDTFSEVPTMAIGGHNAPTQERSEDLSARPLKFKRSGSDEPGRSHNT